MKITTLLILAATLAVGNSNAQTSSKQIKGDKLFASYSYAEAADQYSRVDVLTADGYRNKAVAYTHIGNTAAAEEAYKKFINESAVAEDYFNYAMVLKSNGKYDEANKWMQRFSTAKPNDIRSKDFVANGSSVQQWLKEDGRYSVKRLSINTEQDDFGPTYFQNKIVFASSRDNSPMVDRTYNWNDKPFLDIYIAEQENGELKNVKRLGGDVNKKWHEGPASFSNSGTVMAFTRNNYEGKSKDGVVKFQIYFSELKDDKWSNETPFTLNSSEYSVGHPSLSEDGKIMYFSSDMPGGFGGSDIYRIVKNESGMWGNAENLGNTVNTEGNEMFPFFEPTSAVLFFASNGLVGLGGLDIFMSPLTKSGFQNATNMGASVNSAQDDFGLILDGTLNKGFYSSNRNGGPGGDDLFSIQVLKPIEFTKEIKVNGIVKNKLNNPISNATVVITDESGKNNTLQTNANGMFVFTAVDKQAYTLKASGNQYLDAIQTLNTTTTEHETNVEIVLSDEIIVGMELSKVVDVKPIFFDLGKSDIRADAAAELEKIVAVMNENPTMVVELGSHTDCRGTAAANQKLSDSRAKASAKYIRERITNPERIYGKGFGESKLINGCACEGSKKSNCSEDEHQQNRRTEFIVVKM